MVDLFNKVDDEKKAQIALILKEFNSIDLIDVELVKMIQNENVKALIESYIN